MTHVDLSLPKGHLVEKVIFGFTLFGLPLIFVDNNIPHVQTTVEQDINNDGIHERLVQNQYSSRTFSDTLYQIVCEGDTLYSTREQLENLH